MSIARSSYCRAWDLVWVATNIESIKRRTVHYSFSHMLRAARGLRLYGANVRSCSSIRTMSTKVFVLPIDPTSQPGSGILPSVDPVELWNTAPAGTKPPKVGTTRIFYNTPRADQGNVNATAVVSLGEGFDKKTGDAKRELVRKAVGSGVKQVKDLGDGTKEIVVDASTDAHAAGEPNLGVLKMIKLISHRSRGRSSCQV